MFDKSDNFEGLHWVRGMETYALDQFFDEFYTPGLLAQVVSTGRVSQGPQLLGESPSPKVEILSPRLEEVIEDQTIEVIVRVIDSGGGIDEVKLLHNGKRIPDDVRSSAQQAGDTLTRTYQVDLVSGRNTFVASAFSTGRVESQGHRVTVTFEGVPRMATLYVVAVGINKYKESQLDLNYARADAESVSALLQKKAATLFADIFITELYDENATKIAITGALKEVARRAKPQDVFLFYYSGQATITAMESGSQFYLLPHEITSITNVELLKEVGLSAPQLAGYFSHIVALKQVLILDAGEAGSSVEAFAQREGMHTEEKALAQLARSAGIHVLASPAFAGEFQELGHGIFTYVLLEGLKGGADGAPDDGMITINELKAYLDDQVPLLTEKYVGEAQWPSTHSRGQDFPVVVE